MMGPTWCTSCDGRGYNIPTTISIGRDTCLWCNGKGYYNSYGAVTNIFDGSHVYPENMVALGQI